MTITDVKSDVSQELASRFGSTFRLRRGYRVLCLRDSRTKMQCGVSWTSGKYIYSGTVVVFYILQNGTAYWDWSLRIKRISQSCARQRTRRCAAQRYT
jgi:hypothetical protein